MHAFASITLLIGVGALAAAMTFLNVARSPMAAYQAAGLGIAGACTLLLSLVLFAVL